MFFLSCWSRLQSSVRVYIPITVTKHRPQSTYKEESLGARDMAQQLRELAAPPKD